MPSKIFHDLRTAGLTFLAVTVPVLAINVDTNELLPKSVVADPIPIFFLAMALGILYYRTHRIVPSLALHMAFNAVGVFMAIVRADEVASPLSLWERGLVCGEMTPCPSVLALSAAE